MASLWVMVGVLVLGRMELVVEQLPVAASVTGCTFGLLQDTD